VNPQSLAARQGALAVVEPELGCLVATGPDRASWLNGIVSSDVLAVTDGRGAWGLALTKQAKILSDLILIAGGETLFIGTSPGTAQGLREAFERMLVMEDAELADRSAELAWVRLHGPRAAEIAASCVPDPACAHGAIDWTGLGGAALVVSRDSLESLIEALRKAGAEIGTPADWERLAIERGVPRFGTDYDSGDNPHEASLDQRAVSWTKGCYLGQEVVCMQDMRGRVKRRVVALLVDGSEPPPIGAGVMVDGQQVGEITSAAYSEAAASSVALARIEARHAEGEPVLFVAGNRARPNLRGV
jgi:folate-binding protein YgfZ